MESLSESTSNTVYVGSCQNTVTVDHECYFFRAPSKIAIYFSHCEPGAQPPKKRGQLTWVLLVGSIDPTNKYFHRSSKTLH